MASASKVAQRFMEKTARVHQIEKRPDGWWFIPSPYSSWGRKGPIPLRDVWQVYGAKANMSAETVTLWGQFYVDYKENTDPATIPPGGTHMDGTEFDPPRFYKTLNRFFVTRQLAMEYAKKDSRVRMIAPVTLKFAAIQPDNQFRMTLVFRDLVASKWSIPRTTIPVEELKGGIPLAPHW